MRILVADDSAVIRTVLSRALAVTGADVVGADSAAAAIRRASESFDRAILDLDLGDGTGVDVARALREQAPSLPLAFFTGEREGALVASARRLGPVFAKPNVDAVVAWALGTETED